MVMKMEGTEMGKAKEIGNRRKGGAKKNTKKDGIGKEGREKKEDVRRKERGKRKKIIGREKMGDSPLLFLPFPQVEGPNFPLSRASDK